MRCIVVGLGVQGYKRARIADHECVATVDPVNPEAQFKDIKDIPLDLYDAALLCIPDQPKMVMLNWLVSQGKHVLVEKPLWAGQAKNIAELERAARAADVFIYTAYNHRFEPHFVRMRDLIASGVLGQIYTCRIFYGNGTARLVRNSAWRDQGSGVLHDLGSHLLDTLHFWFNMERDDFQLQAAHCFENKAPDHVTFTSTQETPRLDCEMTLLSWRNTFTCDVYAENGSAHIQSLCKWGPSTFTHRKRLLPSGRPPEESCILVQDDPTWDQEYLAFKKAISEKQQTNLTKDLWLHETLQNLEEQILNPTNGDL